MFPTIIHHIFSTYNTFPWKQRYWKVYMPKLSSGHFFSRLGSFLKKDKGIVADNHDFTIALQRKHSDCYWLWALSRLYQLRSMKQHYITVSLTSIRSISKNFFLKKGFIHIPWTPLPPVHNVATLMPTVSGHVGISVLMESSLQIASKQVRYPESSTQSQASSTPEEGCAR